MEIKVTVTASGVLLSGSLPPEIASAQGIELFPLRDGIYLFALKGAIGGVSRMAAKQENGRLAEKEKGLVRKLLAIRFEKRIPAEVEKALSRDEKETLAQLLKQGVVQIFHGGKYASGGVYNISDDAFNAVREPPSGAAVIAPADQMISSPSHLEKFGWMVLEDEPAARNFAAAYPEKIKSSEVQGIRAFDRKYYFVTRGFFQEWEKKVQLALASEDKTPEELSGEIGIDAMGCRALLYHLCETGETMEKRKGKFARA